MDTSTSVEKAEAPPQQTNVARRAALIGVAVLSGIVLLAMILLIGLRAARAGVLPGVVVGDAEVGGLDEEELRAELAAYGDRRGAEPVTATRPAQSGDERGEATIEATAADVGYELDIDATADVALALGRQANPIAALSNHLRAFFTTVEVEPRERVAQDTLGDWVNEVTEGLRLPPQEGSVRFEGAEVVRIDPVPGLQGDTDALRADAEQAALSPGPDEITVSTQPLEPAVTQEQVDAVFAEAQRAVSAPITLTREGASVALEPPQIASVLRVEPGEGGEGLRIAADPAALRAAVGDPSPLDTPPKDASIQLQGGAVTIVAGTPGFRFNADTAAQQVRDVAIGEGERTIEVEGEVAEPERTREEAEQLRITQQVSTFTTQHACCENRVQNIHRIADMIRGVVIEPGESFSVNGFIGERTPANGFVPAPAIDDGEFVQAIGGGVSQFATTMFNAAYLGGYDILEFKPHSQYISRYPEGREATLNYPNVDLEIRNNSPHGLYIHTSYTDTSITVSFYASPWVDVTTSTGGRSNFRGPETIVRPNPDLAPGEERVIQEGGGEGFDVTVTRTMGYHAGGADTESFTTSYVARPTIIERG